MDRFLIWADLHPGFIVGGVWVFVLSLWIGNFALRLAAGKPIIPKAPESALFVERQVTGRSLRHLLSSLSLFKRALLIVVTSEKITVQFSFPFSIMPFPKADLEQDIVRSRLRKVEVKDALFGQKKTIVEFSTPSRGDEQIELRLQNHEQFLKAVEDMRRGTARR